MLKNISRQFTQNTWLAAAAKTGKPAVVPAKKTKLGFKKPEAPVKAKSTIKGSRKLRFKNIIRTSGYEKNAPSLSFLDDLKGGDNLEKLNGQVLKYEANTQKALTKLGSFKKYQHHELFANPISLVSTNLIELYQGVISNFDNFNNNKWCLQGEHRSGKSTLLSQVQALALSQNKDVILIHIDHCEKFRDGTTDFIHNRKAGIYQQPFLTKSWLLRLAAANEKVFKKILLSRDVNFVTDKVTFNYKKGKNNLYEFVTNFYGVNKFEVSLGFQFFIDELKACQLPVLVTIDNFNALTLQPDTQYKTPNFTPIHITNFELGKFIFDLIKGSLKFEKGGLLLSESSDIGKSQNLLVGLGQLEYDPYKSKGLDLKVIKAISQGQLQSFKVNNLSKDHVANLVKFYHQVGVLHIRDYAYTQKNENQVLEGVDLNQTIEYNYVKSSGNPGLLLKHIVLNY